MEIVLIYEAIVNSNGTEGRGCDKVIGRFFTESAAKSFLRGKDVKGSDGKVRPQYALKDDHERYCVLGPPVDVAQDELDIKRQNALSKLTPEERKLLGLA